MHAHTNGDLSAEALIDIIRKLQSEKPRVDHRTTLEHFAYAHESQIGNLKALGIAVSANPYYQFILADTYAENWLGEDIARHMVPLGTAARQGLVLALHSDNPMAPLQPLGRGCLDTVPSFHPTGTPVICWQHMANATASQFASGETVGVKMLPQTGFGTLPLAQAPEDQVLLNSRAIRPLPPGNFRGDGLFVQMLSGTEAALTWAHRDRLAQTSGVFDDYSSPDIGPEPGVSYEVRIHWVDVATEETLEPAAAVINAGQATTLTLTDADYPQPPIGVEKAAIRVRAVRDGYEDHAFREYRVLVGGKVQITDQELTVFFSGPGVDVTRQELILPFTGPGVDVTAQDLVLGFTGPGVDLTQQDLILSFEPPEMGIIAQELVIEMNP